jgi:hypothetical protein
MNDTIISFFRKPTRVVCDRNCLKAWGIQCRPKVQLSEDNEDDFYYLADDELGEAPANPGTYEGGWGKPSSPDHFPNAWCVRECERSTMSGDGKHEEPLTPPNFSKRFYNMPSLHEEAPNR